jgi:hypothetical protein
VQAQYLSYLGDGKYALDICLAPRRPFHQLANSDVRFNAGDSGSPNSEPTLRTLLLLSKSVESLKCALTFDVEIAVNVTANSEVNVELEWTGRCK